MKIAVEGCAHGELEKIYDTIANLEQANNFKVDLLICCGDFQSARNEDDLHCMAIPQKYHNICTFHKYYSGEKLAPILTIFIGGNHEASNYLQELPYGGWVAPRIYYMGYANVLNIGGVRIGGISGIYKAQDYMKGHHEHSPYSEQSKRSVYHIRNLEVFRLKQLSGPIKIFMSHDWPTAVWNYGNKEQLLRFKPFFEQDMDSGKLGSKPAEELMKLLQPQYWFSAHLHCKFAALIPHDVGKSTKFLALDKCLPKRRFLQVIDVEDNGNFELLYDLEWLAILRLTNHLLSVTHTTNYMPGPNSNQRYNFTPTEEERDETLKKMGGDLTVPNNFKQTGPVYKSSNREKSSNLTLCIPNEQTVDFCKKIGVDDPLELLLNLSANSLNSSSENRDIQQEEDDEQTFLEDTIEEDKKSVNEVFPSFKEHAEETKEELVANAKLSPAPKKFKGRNSSMYSSNENEEIV